MNSGAVTTDGAKTRKIQIALGATALAGLGLIVAGFGLGWVAVVAGTGGLIAIHFVGGAGTASCPHCEATFAVQQVRRRRIAPCPRCGAWLAGVERMSDVPGDAWEDKPSFWTDLPESFAWGDGCACCDAPAVKRVEVKSIPKPGSPMPIALVTKIEAPVCQKHADPHANLWLMRSPEGTAIGFRSLQAMRRFSERNGIAPQQSANAFWRNNDAARPLQ